MMTMRTFRRLLALAAVVSTPSMMHAQADSVRAPAAPASPFTQGPPVRRISTASALSTEQLGSITGVRQLRDGRVLLNDGTRRRLLLLDTTLKVVGVVLDSLSESANFYGTRPGALLAYLGDTTLFVDPASYAMIVLDPVGRFARVRSVPRVRDAGQLASTNNGHPGLDSRGRIVYRINAEAAPPKIAPPRGTPFFPQDPDSAFIVAIDIETRRVDTLGSMRTPKSENSVRISPDGGWNFNSVTNPMPATDEWAVLSDGTVAFLRFRDYRVEYLHGDGTLTSSPKLPYDWQRMTDELKQKLVDSVRQQQNRGAMYGYMTSMIRWVNQYDKSYPADLSVPEGFNLQQGIQRGWKLPPGLTFPAAYVYGCGPGEEPVMLGPDGKPLPPVSEAPAATGAPRPGERGPERASPIVSGGPPGPPRGRPSCIPGPVTIAGGNAPPAPQLRTQGVMAPEDLPDYRPPFNQGNVRADGDGNLWVRINTAKPVPGGPVYDVISRKGELVDRLQLPPGYQLVGFGAGRIVYLSMRDQKGVHLARVRLR